ncbi:MAG TPA: hypothetical protein VGD27_17380 [Longimicrobiales bacterium]
MRSLLLLSLVVLMVSPASAQHGFWQPDDRILISSFLYARGIATDQRQVFVATTNGLEIYDQTFQRWLPPSTIEDGYPALEVPARLAYDARERGVWLLTEAQTLYTWSPMMQRWQQRFISDLPAEVQRRLQSPLDERDPAWAIMRNFAGRDAQGRNWPATGLEAAERPGTFWASTYGGNFSFIDTRNLSAQSYAFGTIGRGVQALALDAAGQLYFGGDGRGPRHGVTRADTTLQQWQQFEARVADGPQRRVFALLPTALGVYAAGDGGVFVLRNARWQRIIDDDARALATAAGRTWVGTRGTLGWVDATDNFVRIEFAVQSVNALATRHDTLWVGAQSGLFRVVAEQPQLVAAAQPIFDLAWSNDMLVAITAAGLHTWDGTRLSTPVRHTSLQQIGRLVSLTAIGDRIYIGGQLGIAEWQPKTNAWRHLTVPDDVPEGPVYDVLEENGRLWLATPAGALRLQWP